MSLAIETAGLRKTYKRPRPWREALRHPFRRRRLEAVAEVALRAAWGELHALVGPNGAGKTTLLKLLCGLLLPEAGSAQVAGHDVLRHAAAVRAATGLVISDERSFYWRLNGRHNLEFFAALHGLGFQQAKKRASEVADQLGLADDIDKPFREYSTGMRQKLAICRGILHKPKVLLLDEPTRGIDLEALRGLRAYLREFATAGGTALIASHDLAEIETLDCTVTILDKGKVRAAGTVAALKQELGVADRYLLAIDRVPASPPQHPDLAKWERESDERVSITLKPGAPLGGVLAALTSSGIVVRACSPHGGNLEAVLDARRDQEDTS